jgi:phosphatidylserine decarboxylase
MGWRALLALLGRLPQPALSRLFGRLATVPIPRPIRPAVLGTFARFAGIDTNEMAHAIESFPTLDAFFVRTLRTGLRTWPEDPTTAGSPVDGVVGMAGEIRDGTLVQAKGRTYTAAALLDDAAEAERMDGGRFLTLYLSPRHYHRIHAPTGDRVVKARHVPGRLMPVNDAAVRQIHDLFPRNERLIAWLEGPLGRVAVVAVGAYNVGRISAAFDGWDGAAGRVAVTNRKGAKPMTRAYEPAIGLARGEELMAFHLGSTVVLLFERGVVLEPLAGGSPILLGTAIARRSQPAAST